MELPALRDMTNPVRDILYIPIPDTDSEFVHTYYTYSSFNHGLSYQKQLPTISVIAKPKDHICSFSTAHSPEMARRIGDDGLHILIPGLMRLGRSTTVQSEVLLGNTRKSLFGLSSEEGHEYQLDFSRGVFVDDTSGKWVQMAYTNDDRMRVVLHTFDI